jgi:hypothetical protein
MTKRKPSTTRIDKPEEPVKTTLAKSAVPQAIAVTESLDLPYQESPQQNLKIVNA